jgi:hypothetical protein
MSQTDDIYSSDNDDNTFPSMEINLQAEKSAADICRMIDEMYNQPSTSAGQSFSSSSFQYNPQNVSFVLPEHLRLISRCLLAQKSIFELLESSTNLRKNLYFVKPQTDEDSNNNDNLFPSMEIVVYIIFGIPARGASPLSPSILSAILGKLAQMHLTERYGRKEGMLRSRR